MSKMVVVGAGGIGVAIATRYARDGIEVQLLSRQRQKRGALPLVALDYLSESAVADYIQQHGLPDALVICCGLLHAGSTQPEKSITQMTENWLLDNMSANVLPSMIWLKAITKHLKKNDKIKAACLSARVGSISDNRLGGWHSYRMSKAALNMMVKNVAIEWKHKSPQSLVIGYHPGTVDTALSKPFQKNIAEAQLFTQAAAADYFHQIFEGLECNRSGELVDWQGMTIPY